MDSRAGPFDFSDFSLKEFGENIGDIWLGASNKEIDNVEIIWEKLGFTFHKEITTNTPYYSEHKIYGRRIYKKLQHNK